MVKFYETKSVFDFTWEQVAQGFWRRYPNPESMHVLSEDTFFREVRDGKLYSKRLLTKTNKMPKLGEKFVNNRIAKILEESVVDPKRKIMITYTRNLSYTSVMCVAEKVVYKVCEEDPSKTVAVRSARIDSQVRGFSHIIQSFGVERFKKNCSKAVNGFNFVLHSMFPRAHAVSSQVDSVVGMSNIAQSGKDKLKGAAKKATDLAKSKTHFANFVDRN